METSAKQSELTMEKSALVIGNSDGIGLELTNELLRRGFAVTGLSKRETLIENRRYKHFVSDVTDTNYKNLLSEIVGQSPKLHLCIYCAGIGDKLDLNNLEFETKVFQVNLMAAVVTTEVVLKKMLNNGEGNFIGLSSIADGLTSSQTPGYNASKAGISKYWEGLGLALKSRNIFVTNIRLGFVDTKMAKSPVKPLLMSTKMAANLILSNLEKPRIRMTRPRLTWLLVWLLERLVQIKLLVN